MKKINVLICCLCVCIAAASQQTTEQTTEQNSLEQRIEKLEKYADKWRKLKVSGYVQSQYQYGERQASLRVGSDNEDIDHSFDRIGIRRGRIKVTYGEQGFAGVFQLDITEKGVAVKDVYVDARDTWLGTPSLLRLGVYSLPFGYEVAYSSSKRESPERSAVIEALFPGIRDLGAMLQLQPAENSPFNFLKLNIGLFAGNGLQKEIDSKRDFTGRISARKESGDFGVETGFSYYRGFVYQGTENVYTMVDNAFVVNNNPSNIGQFAKRQYFGFDGRLTLRSPIGKSQLRGEYIFGCQPGMGETTKSYSASVLPAGDTYIRDFKGGYMMFVQSLGKSPVSAVVKYDWYDPNTKVSKEEAGLNGTGRADIAVNSIGLGTIWHVSKPLLVQAYYQICRNEKSANIPDYSAERKDNTFTLRLQYAF